MSIECSICGLRMLHDNVAYTDGQLVSCTDGHVAMVSGDAESDPYVGEAELASDWVLRLTNAFSDAGRKNDVRTLAKAVKILEKRLNNEGELNERAVDYAESADHGLRTDSPDRR